MMKILPIDLCELTSSRVDGALWAIWWWLNELFSGFLGFLEKLIVQSAKCNMQLPQETAYSKGHMTQLSTKANAIQSQLCMNWLILHYITMNNNTRTSQWNNLHTTHNLIMQKRGFTALTVCQLKFMDSTASAPCLTKL